MTVRLTSRERECLAWAARGKSGWETGQILGISEHTVAFHRRRAMAKFATTQIITAVARAVALGLVDIDQESGARDQEPGTRNREECVSDA